MNFSDFLLTVSQFSALSNNEIEALEKAMAVRDYPDGHVFIKEGKGADAMYLLVEGEVVVTHKRLNERGHIELKRLKPGEIFGLLALIDHGKRAASCTAAGRVRVASLPHTAFDLLYQANAPLAHHFQHIIARQLSRDFRALIKVVRDIMVSGDASDVEHRIRVITLEYTGPERRSVPDRRRGPRRRSVVGTTP